MVILGPHFWGSVIVITNVAAVQKAQQCINLSAAFFWCAHGNVAVPCDDSEPCSSQCYCLPADNEHAGLFSSVILTASLPRITFILFLSMFEYPLVSYSSFLTNADYYTLVSLICRFHWWTVYSLLQMSIKAWDSSIKVFLQSIAGIFMFLAYLPFVRYFCRKWSSFSTIVNLINIFFRSDME